MGGGWGRVKLQRSTRKSGGRGRTGGIGTSMFIILIVSDTCQNLSNHTLEIREVIVCQIATLIKEKYAN